MAEKSKPIGVRDEIGAGRFHLHDFQHSENMLTETKPIAKEALLRCVPSASRAGLSKSRFSNLCGV